MWGRTSAGCLLLCLIFLSQECHGALSTISYINNNDKAHLKDVFTSNLESQDLSAVHYAVLGLKLLGSPVPNEQALCKLFLDSSKNPSSHDVSYYSASGWKSLGCKGTFASPDLTKKLDAVVTAETSSIADIYYTSLALNNVAQKVQEPAKVVKNIKNALKKDDSLANLGYALHIATLLGADGSFMFDRIEDVIVQADEVDGKYLQFEGGLSTTALIISGVYQLSQGLNKSPTLSGDQAVKFANYFVSRRSVTTAKGAYHLLNVAKIFSSNKYHIPVVISVASSDVSVSLEQPLVKASVTDLLGNPLPNTLSVTAESVTKVLDGVVVASKVKFNPVPNQKGVYSLNLMERKPEPGSYRVVASVSASPADSKLVGGASASLGVKVMCWLTVHEASIGTGDNERATKPKLEAVTFPSQLPRQLEADGQQRLFLQFSLKDKQTSKPTTVHQAFVRLSNRQTGQEVIMVVETPTGADKIYKFEVDLGAKAALLSHLSGLCSVSLVVGDAVVANSFVWELASLQLRLGDAPSPPPHTSKQLYYKPKPEITHLFREAERRPPVVVSNLFTALVLLPILILFILWGKMGVNISNFPFKLSAIGFHLCLGGIFGLFGLFWLQLNMFETLKYLFFLSVVTFWTGNSLLSHIATSKKH